MKKVIVRAALAVMGLALGTVIGEIGARLFVAAPYSYNDVLRQRLTDGPRLYAPGMRFVFNADGLYKEAPELIQLRTSQDRFIEPQQAAGAKYRVLFLGGSTTESLYVQEKSRWVALLNEPGAIATYNAGQSGANILDAYYTFKYLEARGDRFDLVVLMTAVNDFTWMRRLEHYRSNLSIDKYLTGFGMWYADYSASTLSSWQTYLLQNSRLLYAAQLAKHSIVAGTTVANAVEEPVGAAMQLPLVETKDCAGYDRDVQDYQENAKANLSLLQKEVSASGSRLLVLSEATSYGALADSFYRDLRSPVTCADETKRISNADAAKLMVTLNGIYLDAATAAGTETFDLASQAGQLSNGPSGGQYMYDSIHYTERGSAMAAALLKPILHKLLNLDPR